MSQYVYSMLRVSKVVPPQKTIIKDISLSFFPGAKIGLIGFEWRGQIHRVAHYGRRGQRI
jgi:sulfate-transporting ATPase